MSTPELDAQLRSPAALRAARHSPRLVLGVPNTSLPRLPSREQCIEQYEEHCRNGYLAHFNPISARRYPPWHLP